MCGEWGRGRGEREGKRRGGEYFTNSDYRSKVIDFLTISIALLPTHPPTLPTHTPSPQGYHQESPVVVSPVPTQVP